MLVVLAIGLVVFEVLLVAVVLVLICLTGGGITVSCHPVVPVYSIVKMSFKEARWLH